MAKKFFLKNANGNIYLTILQLLNGMGSNKSKIWVINNNISIIAAHKPGKHNVEDKESRKKIKGKGVNAE